MAGRHQPPLAPPRTARRLVAALEPPARGPLARAARGTLVVLAGLGLCAALLAAAELHLEGATGLWVRVLVAAALAGCLGWAVRRLRVRIAIMETWSRGLDAMGEALLLSDTPSGRIVHASPAAAALFGRPVDELIGMPARELVLPDDRPLIDARASLRAAGHKVPARITLPVVHPGPGPHVLEWAALPLELGGHELMLSLVHDVTPRQLAERRLAEEHAFLEAVLEAAPGPIMVICPDGRLARVNAAAARLAGMEPAAMVGRAPAELGMMTPEQGAGVGAALRAGRDTFRHDVRWRTPDGAERSVVWSITAMRDDAGRMRSGVAVGQDVTEQRAAEERARRAHAALDLRSRELDRCNRDLAQFSGLAAHELRASVRSVSELTDQLQAHAGPALGARAQELVAAAREAAAGMGALLDGLAAYRRLGDGEALARDVDCERTLDAVLDELAEEIEARGAAVTRDSLPTVPGDPEELGTLLSNLVANALRFGRSEAPRVHVGARRRGLGWQLTVSGNGGGPREADRDAGMGLYLCHRIVERHGGAIWVDDAEGGGGGAFHVTLPDREAR